VKTMAFDCETTGLVESRLKRTEFQPYVTQFVGWLVDLDTGEIEKSVETFVRPPNPGVMKPEAVKATGITWEKIKDCDDFAAHAPQIKSLIEEAPSVAAHNLVFDRDVLDVEARRAKTTFIWPKRQICTIEITSHVTGYRLSLSELHRELFNCYFEGAHDARHDVAALVKCLIEMRKRDWL